MDLIRQYRNQLYNYSDDDSNSPPNKKFGKDVSEYFAEIFKSGSGSDLTIIVKGKNYHLHSWVITARSAYFRAMFETQMIEGRERTVTIDQHEQDVMEDLFEYLYCCKTPKIARTAAELLVAADEYGIDDLKEKCVRFVIGSISTLNAFITFSIAKQYGIPEMEQKATEFIIRNIDEFTPEMTCKFSTENFLELLAAVIKKKLIEK